jgi:hypothetical protein
MILLYKLNDFNELWKINYKIIDKFMR